MRLTRPQLPALYAIADVEALGAQALASAVRRMVEAGVQWVQLRAKRLPDDELYRQAEACCAATRGSGARLWIDDRPDVAALLPVSGVHVGQTDLPPSATRRVVGGDVWIGRSTHNEEQLEEAAADPEVDVVAIGPVFVTRGKRDPDPVVGLEAVTRARQLTDKPLVAIGGIDAERLPRVLAAGADSVAVLGAVCRGDVSTNCARLLAAAGGCA